MNGKTRVLAVLAIVGLVASFALPAVGQQRRSWWSGARSYRRPSPAPRSPGERSPGERRPGEHERPRPMVFQFKHISVESFAETLKQLGKNNEDLAKILGSIPLAVNEEANAIVIIAPPEVLEGLAHIAEGLDRPNEFHIHRQEMEMRERMMDVKVREMERGGGRCAGSAARPAAKPSASSCRQRAGGCGGGRCAGSARPAAKPSASSCRQRAGGCGTGSARPAAKPSASSCRQRAGGCGTGSAKPAAKPSVKQGSWSVSRGPVSLSVAWSSGGSYYGSGTKVMALASSGIVKNLQLSDEQVKRIRGLFGDFTAGMRQLHARVRNAVEGTPPEQRREKYRELRSKVEAELAKRVKALNAKVLGLMAGEQRQGAAKILGVDVADDKPAPKAKPKAKAKPKGKKPKRK